jgi:hypothetical protein
VLAKPSEDWQKPLFFAPLLVLGTIALLGGLASYKVDDWMDDGLN